MTRTITIGAVGVLLMCSCTTRPAPEPVARGLEQEFSAQPIDDAVAARRVSELIEDLVAVKDPGLGYAGAYAGEEFLPYPGSGRLGVLLLQQEPPQPSAAIGELVALGAQSVPGLIGCLDDARSTAIEPMAGLMWTQYADEFDWNRRAEPLPPERFVNREFDAPGPSEPYQVRVGDLCVVALGQIFNRSFNAVRYQPSGGLVINSPVRSLELRRLIVERFGNADTASHRNWLTRDLLQPDSGFRNVGAALRLSFYYPEVLDEVIPGILQRPTYDVFAAESMAHDRLYPEQDPERRRALFEQFVRENGPAGRTGLELQLFEDLEDVEDVDAGRMAHDFIEQRNRPRELLIAFYGFPESVRSSDRPYPEFLTHFELASLVEVLQHDRSRIVDQAVRELMASTRNVDIALACMPRLAAHGYEDDARRAARRLLRAGVDKRDAARLRNALAAPAAATRR